MISKLLMANRGEIAIRAFRAAYEMGIAPVVECGDIGNPPGITEEALSGTNEALFVSQCSIGPSERLSPSRSV